MHILAETSRSLFGRAHVVPCSYCNIHCPGPMQRLHSLLLLLVPILLQVVVLLFTTIIRHAAGKKNPEHDTHVLQGLKVLTGAVNLSGGEILYRPVFGSKFGSKKKAMQDFVASFLWRSSATAKVLHVQLATPIVKCEPALKLRKNNVALMFNHKRSHPRTLAAAVS